MTKYLAELLRWGRKHDDRDDFEQRRELVRSVFTELGAALIGNLLQATLFCVAIFMIPDIGEVFMEALLTDRPVRRGEGEGRGGDGLITDRVVRRGSGALQRPVEGRLERIGQRIERLPRLYLSHTGS